MTISSHMQKSEVGEVRPSQTLTTFGIGSLVDLPNMSVIVMGLDDWPSAHSTEIAESNPEAPIARRSKGRHRTLRQRRTAELGRRVDTRDPSGQRAVVPERILSVEGRQEPELHPAIALVADVRRAALTPLVDELDAVTILALAEGPSLISFFGRFHPATVHFPIAMLGVAALMEFLQIIRKKPGFHAATFTLAAVATVSAVLATLMGLANASGRRPS